MCWIFDSFKENIFRWSQTSNTLCFWTIAAAPSRQGRLMITLLKQQDTNSLISVYLLWIPCISDDVLFGHGYQNM